MVLDANPLTDIRNSDKISGVMVNGRLYRAGDDERDRAGHEQETALLLGVGCEALQSVGAHPFRHATSRIVPGMSGQTLVLGDSHVTILKMGHDQLLNSGERVALPDMTFMSLGVRPRLVERFFESGSEGIEILTPSFRRQF